MRKSKKRGTVETQGEFGTKTSCRADMAGAASTGRQEMEALSDCCTKELLLLPYPYFQLLPACSGTTLRVSMGMEKANKTVELLEVIPLLALSAPWSQPCTSCM